MSKPTERAYSLKYSKADLLNFAIPERRAYPIHTARQALIAIEHIRMDKGDPKDYPRVIKRIRYQYLWNSKVQRELNNLRLEDKKMNRLNVIVDYLEEANKIGVDYWRTTRSGHKVGFEGEPNGKNEPVAGNPFQISAIMRARVDKVASAKKLASSAKKKAKKMKETATNKKGVMTKDNQVVAANIAAKRQKSRESMIALADAVGKEKMKFASKRLKELADEMFPV